MIFRFDDCIGYTYRHDVEITEAIKQELPDAEIMWAISPLGHRGEFLTGRIYPKIWNALSDYREFYKVNYASELGTKDYIIRASHGLIHIDHRILDRSAQEMSILVSCNLIGTKIFVPPFNKWNKHTEDICTENDIELIKFEHYWRCAEYNAFDADRPKWYLHAREFTPESIKQWIQNK